MCKQLAKVATQWNSGMTRDSNRGRQVLIPSVLTTRPLSHKCEKCDYVRMTSLSLGKVLIKLGWTEVDFLLSGKNFTMPGYGFMPD